MAFAQFQKAINRFQRKVQVSPFARIVHASQRKPIGLGCFVVEGLVLLLFKNFCPLTLWARKYSTSTRHNFDIYIPNRLAKYNKIIYSSLLGMVVVILVYRLVG
jgi:hypothetical protein